MELSKDLREFVELLNSRKIKYVLVGGHAVAFHGHPRYTGDVDFLIDNSPENAAQVAAAVGDFGFGGLGLKAEDFRTPEFVIQLGRPPNRIDILTSVEGVTFDEVWKSRLEAKVSGLPIWIISKELLLRNKLAAGRPQDLADEAELRKTG
jgi:predicted nucleotidyltransferase